MKVRCSVYFEWVVAIFIAMAVTSAWRGTWVLLDLLLLPTSPTASALVCLAVGSFFMAVLAFFQPWLAAWARRHQRRRALWVADALYTYVGHWTCVCVWRGTWALWDQARLFSPSDNSADTAPVESAAAVEVWALVDAAVSHVAGLMVLLLMGSLRNLVAPPMLISSDASPPIFGAGARTTCLHAYLPPCRVCMILHVPAYRMQVRLLGSPF